MRDFTTSNLVFALIGMMVLTVGVAGLSVASTPSSARFASRARIVCWVGAGAAAALILLAFAYTGRDRWVDNDLAVPCAAAVLLFGLIAEAIKYRRMSATR